MANLIADVFEILLVEKDTGNTIATTTLQSSDIEFSVNENEVRGGRGNQLLGVLHSDRDITISSTDAEFRYDWLAKQLGQDVVTGEGVAYAFPKFYTVVDGGAGEATLTLDNSTTDDTAKIFTVDGVEVTGFTVSGADVDFTSATPAVAVGDQVEVRTYKYNTDASTEKIEIDNSIFATGVIAVLETLEISGNEIPQYKLQYRFDNAVPTGNFTISTAAEKTASTQDFQLRILKPETSTVVGEVLRIPISA